MNGRQVTLTTLSLAAGTATVAGLSGWAPLPAAVAVSTVLVGGAATTRAHPAVAVLLTATVGLWLVGATVRAGTGVAEVGVEELALLSVGLVIGAAVASRLERLVTDHRATVTVVALAAFASPLLPIVGRHVRGASAWVELGGVQVTPGEVARPLLALAVAGWAHAAGERLRTCSGVRDALAVLLPVGVPLAGSAAILTVAHDFGPLLLLAITTALVVGWASRRPVVITVTLGAGAIGVAAGRVLSSNARGRIDAWLFADPSDQQREAVAVAVSGAWTGRGVDLAGASGLPDADADLVAALLGASFGAVGLWVVALLVAVIATVGFTVAARRPGLPGVLAGAVTWTLLAPWVVGPLGVVGAAPFSGVTSPFLSSGRSSLTASALLVGTLASAAAAVPAPIADPRPLSQRHIAVSMVVLVSTVLMVGRLQLVPARGWELDRDRIADSLARSAFELRPSLTDVQGRPLAWYEDGRRRWTSVSQLAVVAGAGGPMVLDRGLEAHPAVAQGACPVHPVARIWCRSRTVRTTLDLEVQRAVSAVAEGHGADIVVLDGAGGLVAAADATPPPLGPREASFSSAGPKAPASLTALSPPGSVAKIVTAVAAGPSADWRDDGSCPDPTWPRLFVLSCNAPFVRLAADLHPEGWVSVAEDLGFAGDLGRALGWPAEAARLPLGAVPVALRDATLGGGGMAVSPLHGAVAALTIATGERATPHLVVGDATSVPAARAVAHVRDAMLLCVTDPDGTCRDVAVPSGWQVGAKTGTADLGPRTDGWIVAFAEDLAGQRWSVAVRVIGTEEAPRRSGGRDAGPVVGAVLRALDRNTHQEGAG
jgi:cell division protein FtsW (lipid II flippase)